MTNPYSGLEHISSATDYLPAEEQIQVNSPGLTKGIMEVWRDTANQLDAERMISKKAHEDFTSIHKKYMSELDAKLRLEQEVKKEKELKKLAIQELNGFKEQYKEQKEHLEKIRRHRDELAEKVGQARATRTALNEWLEAFDNDNHMLEPIEALREIANRLEKDLGEGNA